MAVQGLLVSKVLKADVTLECCASPMHSFEMKLQCELQWEALPTDPTFVGHHFVMDCVHVLGQVCLSHKAFVTWLTFEGICFVMHKLNMVSQAVLSSEAYSTFPTCMSLWCFFGIFALMHPSNVPFQVHLLSKAMLTEVTLVRPDLLMHR